MSQHPALIDASPRFTRRSGVAASLSTGFASITAFFAGSAYAREQARHAAYLSEATDLYDLEARMRELDKRAALV